MAWSFNGNAITGSYLEAGAVLTATPLTLACWFRQNKMSGDAARNLIALNDNSNNGFSFINGWALQFNANAGVNTIRAWTGHSGNISAAVSNNSVGDNFSGWNHAAATYASDTNRTAWLNGIPGTTLTTSVVPTSTNVTDVGTAYISGSVSDEGFLGLICDVAIWNVALNPDEILELATCFARPVNIRPGNLITWLPMDKDLVDYARGTFFANSSTTKAIQQNSWPMGCTPQFGQSPRNANRGNGGGGGTHGPNSGPPNHAYTQTLEADNTPVGTMVRANALIREADNTPVATLSKSLVTVISLEGDNTPVASMVRQTGLPLEADNTPVTTMAPKSAGKILRVNTAPVALMVRAISYSLLAITTPVATMMRLYEPIGSMFNFTTPIASIVRQTDKIVTNNTTPQAFISHINHYARTLLAIVTPAAYVIELTVKVLNSVVTTAAYVIEQTNKFLTTMTGEVGTIVEIILNSNVVMEARAYTEAFITFRFVTTVVVVTANVLVNAFIIKNIGYNLSANNTPIASIIRSMVVKLLAITTPIASIVRQTALILEANNTPQGFTIELTGKGQILNAVATPIASIVRRTAMSMIVIATPVASIIRHTSIILTAALATAATFIFRGQPQPLTAITTPIASMIEAPVHTITAVTTPQAFISHLPGKVLLAIVNAIASIIVRPRFLDRFSLVGTISGDEAVRGQIPVDSPPARETIP